MRIGQLIGGAAFAGGVRAATPARRARAGVDFVEPSLQECPAPHCRSTRAPGGGRAAFVRRVRPVFVRWLRAVFVGWVRAATPAFPRNAHIKFDADDSPPRPLSLSASPEETARMKTPINPFKKAIAEKRTQYGLWVSLMGPLNTEICAAAGFDWLLLDARTRAQRSAERAAAGAGDRRLPGRARHRPHPHGPRQGRPGADQAVPRRRRADPAGSHGGDGGASPRAGALHALPARRHPRHGRTRASGWGRNASYAKEANEQVCLLVQVETQAGVRNLDAIAAVEGVDGVFIGPADLSAAFGHVGDPWHPEMMKMHEDAVPPHPGGRQGGGHPDARRSAGEEARRDGRHFHRGGHRQQPDGEVHQRAGGKFKGAPPQPEARGNY